MSVRLWSCCIRFILDRPDAYGLFQNRTVCKMSNVVRPYASGPFPNSPDANGLTKKTGCIRTGLDASGLISHTVGSIYTVYMGEHRHIRFLVFPDSRVPVGFLEFLYSYSYREREFPGIAAAHPPTSHLTVMCHVGPVSAHVSASSRRHPGARTARRIAAEGDRTVVIFVAADS